MVNNPTFSCLTLEAYFNDSVRFRLELGNTKVSVPLKNSLDAP